MESVREANLRHEFSALEASNRALDCGTSEFLPLETFDWVPRVEACWAGVRAELDTVLTHVDHLPNFQDIQNDQRELTADAAWKVFPFFAYGSPFTPNLQRCPQTAAALALIPGMTSAMYSVLLGPKKLPPHRGPFNGVLRYHLALRVPGDPEKCRIRVGSTWRSWVERQSLIFDDTLEHEVVSEHVGPRVVLFVDFLRPGPAELMRRNAEMVKAIAHSPAIESLLRNLGRWNVDFEKSVNQEPSS